MLRSRIPKRQWMPLAAHPLDRLRPGRRFGALLTPPNGAGLVAPLAQLGHRVAVGAAADIGQKRGLIAPHACRPIYVISLVAQRSGHVAVRSPDLRQAPLRMEQEEGQKPQAANAEASYADDELAPTFTTSLVAETPRLCRSSATGIAANLSKSVMIHLPRHQVSLHR